MRIDGHASPSPPDTDRQPTATGRALVPTGPRQIIETDQPTPAIETMAIEKRSATLRTGRQEILNGVDVRALTPRQMADFSLDIYAAGVIPYEEYSVLAYQPELHPNYNRTVGALTGEPAAPDSPRDFIELWEDRLSFELRHGAQNSKAVVQTERILGILKQISNPTEIAT